MAFLFRTLKFAEHVMISLEDLFTVMISDCYTMLLYSRPG